MSEPDLLSLGSGGKLTGTPAKPKRDPVDMVIRTVYGEADNDPASRQAVAGVVLNRSKSREKGFDEVVLEPSQFEAWSNPKARARMEALSPDSPEYQQIAADIAPVLSGEVSLPYTHFYSPGILKERGKSAPKWDDGTGQTVGTQLFFALDDDGGDMPDLLALGGWRDGTSETTYDESGNLVAADSGQAFTAPQQETYRKLVAGLALDPDAPVGSPSNPWMQRSEGDSFDPGAYFIAPDGKLTRMPGGEEVESTAGGGFKRGVGDIYQTVAEIAPFAAGTEVGQRLEANRLVYDASGAGDSGWAKAGRFSGQVVGTVPPMAVGGAGLGLLGKGVQTVAPVAAPALEFLGGQAGGNLLIRGGSMATRGAGEGAATAALASSAHDAPIEDQIKFGATAGAVLGPAAHGSSWLLGKLGSTGRALVEPFSEKGRNKIVDRFLTKTAADGPTDMNLTEYVPGSRPTLAQATGNPGLAMVEQGVKTRNPTPFESLSRSNQQAREHAIDAVRGDKQSLDDLIAARAAQTDPIREAAFANTRPVDPSAVVAKIDEVLASPAGQRDAVKSALTNLRAKLVKEDGTLEQDPAQLWGIRQAIGDMLSPLSAGTKADGRLASRELLGIQETLDPVIESGAPGFREYLKAFSEASKRVDAQEFLQKQNLTTADGTISLGKVDMAIKRIETARSGRGVHAAKNIPDQDLATLYAVRDDLRRQAQAHVGRGVGSNTAEKLASNALVDSLSLPAALGATAAHPALGVGLSLGKLAYGVKNRQLNETLTERLLDPSLQPPSLGTVKMTGEPNKLFQWVQHQAKQAGALGARSGGVLGSQNLLLPRPQEAP